MLYVSQIVSLQTYDSAVSRGCPGLGSPGPSGGIFRTRREVTWFRPWSGSSSWFQTWFVRRGRGLERQVICHVFKRYIISMFVNDQFNIYFTPKKCAKKGDFGHMNYPIMVPFFRENNLYCNNILSNFKYIPKLCPSDPTATLKIWNNEIWIY